MSARLGNLIHLSWNVNLNIPERIIAKLEQSWPKAKLLILKYDLVCDDLRSLSSPSLHSLKYSILNHTATVVATDQLAQYSKFPDLRKVLIDSSNLKNLDIEFKYNWMSRNRWPSTNATPHLLYLPLQPSDKLPTLEELSFSGPPETYEFDLDHCQLLSQCMDWSRLTRLDLGISCPQHFFEQIGWRLCSLKSLSMGIRTGSRYWCHWAQGPLTCESLDPITSFIDSLPELHELCLVDMAYAVDSVAPIIVESQHSLRKLSYTTSMHRKKHRGTPLEKRLHTWTQARLRKLLERCPDLTQLEIDFPLNRGKWVREAFH